MQAIDNIQMLFFNIFSMCKELQPVLVTWWYEDHVSTGVTDKRTLVQFHPLSQAPSLCQFQVPDL